MVDQKFDGIKAFDCHPYRTEDEDGVWDFVERNMRTYKILEEKVHEVKQNRAVCALLEEIQADDKDFDGLYRRFTPAAARKLKGIRFDPDRLARGRKLAYEKLDQILTELLLGVR